MRPAATAAVAEAPPIRTEDIALSGEADIRRDLEAGRYGSAVKKAKELHRQHGTARSEALVCDVYEARIRQMVANGLTRDAEVLAEVVAGRYAAARGRLEGLRMALAADRGDWGPLASALSAPADSAERALAERVVREQVTDLVGLASCESLPPGHDLRRAARAVADALAQATTGPVAESALALAEVSRRSPLAPWKPLVRAIGCFYRGQNERSGTLLEAVDPRSTAARLVAPMLAMLDGGNGADLPPAPARLVAGVCPRDPAPLREALEALDAALARQRRALRISEAARHAIKVCQKLRPELLDRLKQHASIRCFLARVPVDVVVAAIGNSRHDAYFWRLFARAAELSGNELLACALWGEFRRNAVHQGWLAAESPEEAALYLHMIDLLGRLPARELARSRARIERGFDGFAGYYVGQPPEVRAAAPPREARKDTYFWYPDQIFERACRCRSDPDIFRRYFGHVRARSSLKEADEVAWRWHEALPCDPEPLLKLAQAAEARKAFTKALKYLRQAETLDALSPEVKRARLRLLVAKAVGHLRDAKTHLMAKDLAELAELPQAREGGRPAVIAALQWAQAVLAGQNDEQARLEAQIERALGVDLGAAVMLGGLLYAVPPSGFPAPPPAVPDDGKLAQAVAACCAACEDLAAPFEVPHAWLPRVEQELSDSGCRLAAPEVRALGAAALRWGQPDLASAAAGCGLRLGGPYEARFLLLRAQSLPRRLYERCVECLAVAAELARRQRDMDLVGEIVDVWHARRPWWAGGDAHPSDLEVDAEQVPRVLERERRSRRQAAPGAAGPAGPRGASAEAPRTRRRPTPFEHPKLPFEGYPLGGEPDFDDEDDEDDEGEVPAWVDEDECEDDDLDEPGGRELPAPPGLDAAPLEVLELLAELYVASGGGKPKKEHLEKVARERPELIEKVAEILPPIGPNRMPVEFLGEQSGEGQPSRKQRRKARKRQRKAARRGRKH